MNERDERGRRLVARARGVTLRARGVNLIERLDLAVAAGTIHALVGRNGSGKSTLLRAFLGETDFTGELGCIDPIGYVPQQFEPDATVALTVGEFLALTRQRSPLFLGRSASRARVARALDRVGLRHLEQRPLCELSGGERRRVLLGHAFEPEPPLLLLDEPTEGLDAAARERFVELLRAARAAGSGALLVTHDRALVAACADEVTDLDALDAKGAA